MSKKPELLVCVSNASTRTQKDLFHSIEIRCCPAKLLRRILGELVVLPLSQQVFWNLFTHPVKPMSQFIGTALNVTVQPLTVDVASDIPKLTRRLASQLKSHQRRTIAWMHGRIMPAGPFVCEQLASIPLTREQWTHYKGWRSWLSPPSPKKAVKGTVGLLRTQR